MAALTSASTFLQQFYNHPIISGMHQATAGRHFSYLPARAFSAVIMDLVTPGTQGRLDITVLENGIKAMPDGDVKRGLLAAIQNAVMLALDHLLRGGDDGVRDPGVEAAQREIGLRRAFLDDAQRADQRRPACARRRS